MDLNGLHLLLTYQCTLECDHCFAWGSPWQSGTMRLQDVRNILEQAHQAETVKWIYFEGGEPFLYYALLLKGVQRAAAMGFRVGVVSNAYWATSVEDAVEWLRPFSGLVDDLSVSSDLFHYNEALTELARNAVEAAATLDIPTGVISIAGQGEAALGQLPETESGVMYRGRAVEKLAQQARHSHWETFTTCPYEDLRQPGRLHVDPLGYLHVCQGIVLGNMFERPLGELCASYDPDFHPVTGALLAGGPAELVRRYDVPHQQAYADACHLCYQARLALRERFPQALAPGQMYGEVSGQ